MLDARLELWQVSRTSCSECSAILTSHQVARSRSMAKVTRALPAPALELLLATKARALATVESEAPPRPAPLVGPTTARLRNPPTVVAAVGLARTVTSAVARVAGRFTSA